MGIVGHLFFVTKIALPKTWCSGSKALVKSRIFVSLLSNVCCVRLDNGRLLLHSVVYSMAVVIAEEGESILLFQDAVAC